MSEPKKEMSQETRTLLAAMLCLARNPGVFCPFKPKAPRTSAGPDDKQRHNSESNPPAGEPQAPASQAPAAQSEYHRVTNHRYQLHSARGHARARGHRTAHRHC